jgi:hypothetical protein
MTSKIITGIGSRKTPVTVQGHMTHLASIFESLGFTLRSGGADGADLAFEKGIKNPGNKEIYLPEPGFNNSNSKLHQIKPWAVKIAEKHHPNWSRIKESSFSMKLMARNTYQIYGYTQSSPLSDVVVCWTPGGSLSGGTAQAIRIAESLKIPVCNLATVQGRMSIKLILKGLGYEFGQ